jgi:hypothetical protein
LYNVSGDSPNRRITILAVGRPGAPATNGSDDAYRMPATRMLLSRSVIDVDGRVNRALLSQQDQRLWLLCGFLVRFPDKDGVKSYLNRG